MVIDLSCGKIILPYCLWLKLLISYVTQNEIGSWLQIYVVTKHADSLETSCISNNLMFCYINGRYSTVLKDKEIATQMNSDFMFINKFNLLNLDTNFNQPIDI